MESRSALVGQQLQCAMHASVSGPNRMGHFLYLIHCTRHHLHCAIQQGARSKWEACCSHTAVEKKTVHETSGGVATLRNLGSQPKDRTSSLGSSQNPSKPSPHTLYCAHTLLLSVLCKMCITVYYLYYLVIHCVLPYLVIHLIKMFNPPQKLISMKHFAMYLDPWSSLSV